MARIKLSPPWITYYNELNCLFKEDPDIIVIYDEENNEIKLCVDNNEKVCALSGILPTEKDFGTVTMKITVVPSNGFTKPDESKMQEIYTNPYAIAFEGNPVLSYVKQIDTIIMGKITYVVFVNDKCLSYLNKNKYVYINSKMFNILMITFMTLMVYVPHYIRKSLKRFLKKVILYIFAQIYLI